MIERLVPRSRARIALFCSLLALASLRCISDFVVSPGGGPAAPVYRLAFLAEPRAGSPGAPIEPRIRVGVRDEQGGAVDSVAASVTIRLIDGPVGATLGGTTTVAITGGVAVFESVAVDRPGEVRLAAFAAGLAPDTTAPFAVAWPPIDEIELTPDDLRIDALMDSVQLTAVARDEDGAILPPVVLAWSSSNEGVATVTAGGLVIARGNGRTVIRAEAQGVSAQAEVEVRQKVVAITVTPSELTLEPYADAELVAEALDSRGIPVTRDLDFDWHSSRSRSVTVYPGGGTDAHATVRRWRSGTAIITASTEGASAAVTVR